MSNLRPYYTTLQNTLIKTVPPDSSYWFEALCLFNSIIYLSLGRLQVLPILYNVCNSFIHLYFLPYFTEKLLKGLLCKFYINNLGTSFIMR